MASAVDRLVDEVSSLRGEVATVQKQLTVATRNKAQLDDAVAKHLGAAGPGRRVMTQYDGSGESDILSLSRQQQVRKGLGPQFQEFLQLVHAGCGRPGGGGLNYASTDAVEKNLAGMRSQRVTKTALAEMGGFTGGYTVPTEFYAQLLRYMAEESFVRQRCTVVPMQSLELLVPALAQASTTPTTGASNFFSNIVFSWTPEGGTLSESEPTFRQIRLVARTLVITSYCSVQLLQDNAVALDTLLTSIFAEAVAWLYDWYLLNGTGVNQPKGVLNADATISSTRASANTITLVDVNKMMSRFFTGGYKNGIWITSPSCLPQILALADSTNGRLVWLNQAPNQPGPDGGPVAQRIPATIYGMPLYISEKVPSLGTAGDLMLIDPEKMLLGDRLSIQIEASPYPRFLNYQMVWRVALRWDAQPWPSNAIALANGDTVSSFVILAA